MNRILAALMVLALALAVPAGAHAGLRLDRWKGHVAVGFAHVVSDSLAPTGSFSTAAGLEYPLSAKWSIGPALSFDLLGSSTVQRGSIVAGLDYSMFETALLVTYLPAKGPFARVSAGPGLASPRAELSVAAGGLGFRDLTVGELRPEFAADATVMSRHMPTVGVGLEFGARVVPIPSRSTWTLLTARMAIHF